MATGMALFAQHALGTANGALKLDNYTFDKVIGITDHSFVVKFDNSYAYGEKEDEFKALCKVVYDVPNLLVAEVPVQEYGDKDNDDLRERFKLTKDDFPTYLLFDKANKDGLKYSGPITASDIGAWLRRNNLKVPAIGTIADLDVLAKKFLTEGMKDEVMAEAQTLADGTYKTDKKSDIYIKIMQKLKEKGEGYIATETARVTKILGGNVTPEKQAELGDKLKILGMFAEK